MKAWFIIGMGIGIILMLLISCGENKVVNTSVKIDTSAYPDVKPPKAPR